MANRINPGGNGSAGKGMIDTCPVGEGCTLFIPNPTHPPPAELLHVALTDVLQKFILAHPIRVRTTLPIVHDGTTVAIFVWWDRVSPSG
jgi:hypothetical protein